jgi:hypothetical protein
MAHTQNEIAEDIAEGKRTGRYKDCVYLGIMTEGAYSHVTNCEKWSLLPNNTDPDSHCPSTCHFFTDRSVLEKARQAEQDEQLRQKAAQRHREEAQERRRQWIGIARLPIDGIEWLLTWFSKLAAPVQILIVLLIILAIAPQWVPRIVELAKLWK